MVHIASWEVVISESNETRGLHAYELWQPRVLPKKVGFVIPFPPGPPLHNVSEEAVLRRIAIARGVALIKQAKAI